MKREIKFRVFFNDKIVGYERLSESGWEWMAIDLNPDTGERWIPGVFVPGVAYKRDAFTGLKDKNGVEIYEGDILKYQYYKDYGQSGERVDMPNILVTWNKTYAKFDPLSYWSDYHDQFTTCEVVGNIHSNPELL